ncbi:hypothetical protein MNEG_7870 [Monoraphidium neglectum]|uniref:C2 domain-containing protein n=1 Tax=Monoraphidium neglectum TaxID=145388 RepID=A0A0D2JLJ2_9CHLO|nr:hypothetical protein MNEG_7870 [Monoraphidium neglectum]KIZ00093.1 hypothetical protein MNEG_7870 [Monoraphidium neglectum]|eukprot:XP_013899112.1 hypothetical protein MNEG_7870 [Monoraphidium neglectum]
MQGILTVTLVRATALGGWTGEPDPYVELTLYGAGGDASAGQPGARNAKGGFAAAQHRQASREARPLCTADASLMLADSVSNTIWNEANPRFNEKFDFAMIPAGAVLLATVKDRTSTFEKIASLKITDRFKSVTLGRVKVPLMEVAAAGRLRGSWPLQGALEGQLEMVLEWIDAGEADLTQD